MDKHASANVLYMTYDGLTDPLGQSQILPYLIGLAQKGHHITIISFEKEERFKTLRTAIEQQCVSVGIQWHPLLYHKSPPVLSTLYDVLALRRKAFSLHRKNNFNLVHCRSYITPLVGLSLKLKKGIPLLFDMRGFWVEERVEGGLWDLRNPLFSVVHRFFKKKERQFMTHADHVVSLTYKAKTVIEKNFSIPGVADKVTVIPCSADLEFFSAAATSEEDKIALREELGIGEDDFVLLYLGSLGTWYMYREMVQFFDVLKETHPNAKFLFLTPDLSQVEDRPDFMTRSVTRNEVRRYAGICQLSVYFIRPTFSKTASSATKMAELMAMRIPMVTNHGIGDIEWLMRGHQAGYVVNSFSIDEYRQAIRQVLDPTCDRTPSPETMAFLDIQTSIAKYDSIYATLIERP